MVEAFSENIGSRGERCKNKHSSRKELRQQDVATMAYLKKLVSHAPN